MPIQTGRFKPENRLNNSLDYQPVFKTGKKSADKNFLFLFKENDRGEPRLGLAISKKRIHSAVMRNRIKRLIRESFRYNCSSMKKVDVIVLAQQTIDYKNKGLLRKSLANHWQKLKV